MILPNFPVLFGNLPPEKQAEGLKLLRAAIAESFPEHEPQITDDQLANEMANFDLRMVMDEKGMEC